MGTWWPPASPSRCPQDPRGWGWGGCRGSQGAHGPGGCLGIAGCPRTRWQSQGAHGQRWLPALGLYLSVMTGCSGAFPGRTPQPRPRRRCPAQPVPRVTPVSSRRLPSPLHTQHRVGAKKSSAWGGSCCWGGGNGTRDGRDGDRVPRHRRRAGGCREPGLRVWPCEPDHKCPSTEPSWNGDKAGERRGAGRAPRTCRAHACTCMHT